MALDATRLGEKLATAVVDNAPSDDGPVSAGQLQAMWIAIAQEIITEFTANGEVEVSGVEPGSGTASGEIS